MKKTLGLLILLFFYTFAISQQNYTQNIRGLVLDKQSGYPLIGASVIVLNSDPLKGAVTDADGYFTIENVAIGRISLKASYLGYKDAVMSNLILNSGKELFVKFELEERLVQLQEVVIKAEDDKRESLNKMATVSARAFTVEETNRYAGSLGDPARMAMNYAGVSPVGDTRNDIIIRGNSPLGVLWRLEGVDIPNPNHFGSLGTTGGAISILNNNLLANSDFMTGAFPPEYGNVLAGVFDLNMRNGNRSKHEFLGQIGFNGFELGAEGPLPGKGSYLGAVRYSTLEFFERIGYDLGLAAIPHYKDASFKIDIPAGEKYGRFTIFGIGGKSYIQVLDENRDSTDQSFVPLGLDTKYGSKLGILGFTHKYFFNNNISGKLGLVASLNGEQVRIDTLAGEEKILYYNKDSKENKYNISYTVNAKINAANVIKSGFSVTYNYYDYNDSFKLADNSYKTTSDYDGDAYLYKGYMQWQHRFTEQLSMVTGLHALYFSLNGSTNIEPRLGFKWYFTNNQILSFGAGLHSQTQPGVFYFFSNPYKNDNVRTNLDMGLSKAAHLVVRYDYNFTKNMRLRLESYYQHLYDIPVSEKYPGFSIINEGSAFYFTLVDSLENKGTGTNYGLELTLEKFFSDNYYFLFTGTLFESKYKGYNEIERNTAYNGNFIFNLLGGTEFNLDAKKKKILNVNIKATYAGGKRYIPVNLEESIKQNKEVFFYEHAYENRYPDYFRMDFRVGFKLNGKKVTQEWAIDIQNLTDRKNLFQERYDVQLKRINTEYQTGLVPVMIYKVLF